MRQSVISLTLLCLIGSLPCLHAQGPRGRAILMGPPVGPGLVPGYGFRPPMPPIPVPTVRAPHPGYVRIPGVPIPTTPRYVVPTAPTYGYYRSTTVVAIPVPVPYSTARIAVVEPTTSNSPSLFSAGSASYRTAPPTSTTRPIATSNSNDLRPGMVLPDGSVVVSVGQAGNPNPGAQSPTPTVTPSSPTPVPSPVTTSEEPRSILENAEEIPLPKSGGEAGKPPTRQF